MLHTLGRKSAFRWSCPGDTMHRLSDAMDASRGSRNNPRRPWTVLGLLLAVAAVPLVMLALLGSPSEQPVGGSLFASAANAAIPPATEEPPVIVLLRGHLRIGGLFPSDAQFAVIPPQTNDESAVLLFPSPARVILPPR